MKDRPPPLNPEQQALVRRHNQLIDQFCTNLRFGRDEFAGLGQFMEEPK